MCGREDIVTCGILVIPGLRQAILSGAASISAYVIGEQVRPVTLSVGSLTQDEKKILSHNAGSIDGESSMAIVTALCQIPEFRAALDAGLCRTVSAGCACDGAGRTRRRSRRHPLPPWRLPQGRSCRPSKADRPP